jgi:CubicO group peptidase (beta-lactamase class C family)
MTPHGLQDFDSYMAKTLEDWNAPAVGVGVVAGEELVFARGYGFRDYEKKLPFTPQTLFQIASNTKLFTAVAAGMLVEEGKLEWDKPVRDYVPAVRFHDDRLNASVTLRDMLAHRTGITRHDTIWFKSSFSRKELFERLRYLEPTEPIRHTYLYNNMMYMAVGYLIELVTGSTWEEFVRNRILLPLGMDHTVFSIADMVRHEDCAVPFTEWRDTTEIHRIPYYEDTAGIAPAGAIISSIDELSRWLIAIMNQGKYQGRQVVPPAVLKATMEPAIAIPNTLGETRGFWELLNAVYGMGRVTASYRGRLLANHGGALGGFYSQVSCMPQDGLGAIVFVIGNHCAALTDVVSYNLCERLLGMDQTPWSDRWLAVMRKAKKGETEARSKVGGDRVPGTHPSHALEDYVGEFEHPAYGVLRIVGAPGRLRFDFHSLSFPLDHCHYDRFDTPDDELYGKWSVRFLTDPQGGIDKAVMFVDEAEATFVRRPPAVDRDTLSKLVGTYETPDGFPVAVALKEDGSLSFVVAGQPDDKLVPVKGFRFRLTRFSLAVVEFVLECGSVRALKLVDPSGEHVFPRRA